MPSNSTTVDVDELRSRIDNVRALLGTNHALTYVPEEYSNGIHALLVHGVDTDTSGRPVDWECRFEDDAVGAVGGPDTADADELRDRIAKVLAWLDTYDAQAYIPTEYLIGFAAFLEHGAAANPLTAQPIRLTAADDPRARQAQSASTGGFGGSNTGFGSTISNPSTPASSNTA